MKFINVTRIIAIMLLIVISIGILTARQYLNRDLISEAQEAMRDRLARFISPEIKELAKAQAATRLLKEQQTQTSMMFWGAFARYGTVSTLTTLLTAVLMLSAGAWYKLTTHRLKTRYSEIEYRGKLDPAVATGLVLAEQLESRSSEAAVNLYLKLAETNTRQLSALAKGVHGPALTAGNSIPIESQTTPTGDVPTFAQLLSDGTIAHDKPLVFGFLQDGNIRTGDWNDAYSCGIGGQSGFGKSSTIRSLIAQSLINGSVETFFIIDPHYPHKQSLLASLGSLKDSESIQYAENPFDTVKMIEDIDACIDRRIQGAEESYPLKIVVVDEIMAVLKRVPQLKDLVEKIGCESRKAGVYGIFSSQSWVGSKTGGTTARDNLTAILCHRMKKKQALTLLQDNDEAKRVIDLGKGQALFAPVAEEAVILNIPFCKEEDMESVVEIIRQGNGQDIVIDTQASQIESGHDETVAVNDEKQTGTPEETGGNTLKNVMELLKGSTGKSQNELAEQMGISRKDMSLFLNNKPMSDDRKQSIETVFSFLCNAEKVEHGILTETAGTPEGTDGNSTPNVIHAVKRFQQEATA